MPRVDVRAIVKGRTREDVYELISDFVRYPQCTPVVRAVSVGPRTDDVLISTWEVNFRKGILRWTEEDTFDRERWVIRFRQLTGDVDSFAGEWMLDEHDQGCVVRFWADFDMGVPSLSHVIDPIAEETLASNIRLIVTGLVDGSATFPDPDLAPTIESRQEARDGRG
jgi:ribosome-associated toxin RatA of RatAB toxin-antitoxin module